MSNEFNVSLGTAGSGLSVYAVVFDATWNGTESTIVNGNVWTGSALVADSFANRSAGAIPLTESPAGSGTYIGNAPPSLPTGNYQFLEYSRLGGTPNAQTDTQLLLSAGSFFVISSTGLNPVVLSFDPTTPFYGDAQSININKGSGTIFQFVPLSPVSLSGSDWVFKIGTKKFGVSNTYSVTNGNMVVTPTGTIVVNPTIADTSGFDSCQTIYGELWRVNPSDDSTDLFLRIIINAISVLV